MFVRCKQAGHILLVVLIVMFLLALLVHYITQGVILEYQRGHNQILDYQLWQQLEARAQVFMQSLGSQDKVDHGDLKPEVIAFIPDTLEANCTTGIVVFRVEIATDKVPIKLLFTYSERR